jgi:hypothetical protein
MQATEPQPSESRPRTAYHCEICDANFPNEGALRSHQKLQHGDAPNPVELQTGPETESSAERSYGRVPPDEPRDDATRDPAEPAPSDADAELMPEEDRDPSPAAEGHEAQIQYTDYSEFVRYNGRRSSDRSEPEP